MHTGNKYMKVLVKLDYSLYFLFLFDNYTLMILDCTFVLLNIQQLLDKIYLTIFNSVSTCVRVVVKISLYFIFFKLN
jgi:hypothetical protein